MQAAPIILEIYCIEYFKIFIIACIRPLFTNPVIISKNYLGSIANYANLVIKSNNIIIINTGQTELADSAQGTALSQIKTIHVVIYITIDKKSRL